MSDRIATDPWRGRVEEDNWRACWGLEREMGADVPANINSPFTE